jgi:hypothetical protein
MNNAKAEKVLKRVEVVVSVKQRMALSQTKSSNDAVYRLANLILIATWTGFVQISLPLHFTAEPPNRCLGLCLHQ